MRAPSLLTLFLVLCGGLPPGLTGEIAVYQVNEGGNITVRCLIYGDDGDKTSRIFCRNDCEDKEDILVEMSGTKKQKSSGRYSIQYDQRPSPPHVMRVSITNVVSSDSGMYQCETWSGAVQGTSTKFQINVITAGTPSDSATASVSTTTTLSYTVTSTSTSTSTSTPTPAPAFSSVDHNETSPQWREPPSGSTPTRLTLYVALAAGLILLSVTLSFLYWRKRVNKVSTENAQIPECNHLYEDIPDETRSAVTYSLLSQPQAHSQAEKEPCKDPYYAEVDLNKSGGAPRCQTEPSVLYSTISLAVTPQ